MNLSLRDHTSIQHINLAVTGLIIIDAASEVLACKKYVHPYQLHDTGCKQHVHPWCINTMLEAAGQLLHTLCTTWPKTYSTFCTLPLATVRTCFLLFLRGKRFFLIKVDQVTLQSRSTTCSVQLGRLPNNQTTELQTLLASMLRHSCVTLFCSLVTLTIRQHCHGHLRSCTELACIDKTIMQFMQSSQRLQRKQIINKRFRDRYYIHQMKRPPWLEERGCKLIRTERRYACTHVCGTQLGSQLARSIWFRAEFAVVGSVDWLRSLNIMEDSVPHMTRLL